MKSYSTNNASVLVIDNDHGMVASIYKDGRRSISINGLRQCFGKTRQFMIDKLISEMSAI